jgi:hypothetical protein
MKLLPIAALVGATIASTVALTDALWQGFEGTPAPWAPDGLVWMERAGDFAHAIPYLLLAALLVQVGPSIDRGGYSRWVRRLLAFSFVLFGGVMLWSGVSGIGVEALGAVGIVFTVAFLFMLVLPILLGFTLIRRPGLRLPAGFLIAPAVLLPLVFVLSNFTGFAHPGFAETAVNFGVALLGFAVAPAVARSTDAAVAQHATVS